MKWGIRKYQNSDGSLTAAGKSKSINKKNDKKNEKQQLSDKTRQRLKVGAIAVVSALAAYGAYRVGQELYINYKYPYIKHSGQSIVNKYKSVKIVGLII
jgi:hypothetical protein